MSILNRNDIIRIINDSFPWDIVSFDQEFPNEAYCLRQNSEGIWEVYYSERGIKNDLKEYDNESEACHDILKRINPTK